MIVKFLSTIEIIKLIVEDFCKSLVEIGIFYILLIKTTLQCVYICINLYIFLIIK